jgi:hypothetical protein
MNAAGTARRRSVAVPPSTLARPVAGYRLWLESVLTPHPAAQLQQVTEPQAVAARALLQAAAAPAVRIAAWLRAGVGVARSQLEHLTRAALAPSACGGGGVL